MAIIKSRYATQSDKEEPNLRRIGIVSRCTKARLSDIDHDQVVTDENGDESFVDVQIPTGSTNSMLSIIHQIGRTGQLKGAYITPSNKVCEYEWKGYFTLNSKDSMNSDQQSFIKDCQTYTCINSLNSPLLKKSDFIRFISNCGLNPHLLLSLLLNESGLYLGPQLSNKSDLIQLGCSPSLIKGKMIARFEPDIYKSFSRCASPSFQQAWLHNTLHAYKSSSFGIGQIMGFNYSTVGYSSPQMMINAFHNEPLSQIKATKTFIMANPDLSAAFMKSKPPYDLQTIASIYNGPNYKKYRYDTNLANNLVFVKRLTV